MFDIGFSELVVIGVVALVVIGPERLPRVARTAGHLFGRLQRYVSSVKADISREMELDELRKFKSEIEQTGRSMEHSIAQQASEVQQQFPGVTEQVTSPSDPGSQADGAAKPDNAAVQQLELGLEAQSPHAPSPRP